MNLQQIVELIMHSSTGFRYYFEIREVMGTLPNGEKYRLTFSRSTDENENKLKGRVDVGKILDLEIREFLKGFSLSDNYTGYSLIDTEGQRFDNDVDEILPSFGLKVYLDIDNTELKSVGEWTIKYESLEKNKPHVMEIMAFLKGDLNNESGVAGNYFTKDEIKRYFSDLYQLGCSKIEAVEIDLDSMATDQVKITLPDDVSRRTKIIDYINQNSRWEDKDFDVKDEGQKEIELWWD